MQLCQSDLVGTGNFESAALSLPSLMIVSLTFVQCLSCELGYWDSQGICTIQSRSGAILIQNWMGHNETLCVWLCRCRGPVQSKFLVTSEMSFKIKSYNLSQKNLHIAAKMSLETGVLDPVWDNSKPLRRYQMAPPQKSQKSSLTLDKVNRFLQIASAMHVANSVVS